MERICSFGCVTATKLRRGYCTRHYNRWRIYGDPTVLLRPPASLWRRVLWTDTCWLWTGPLNHSGYASNAGQGAHRQVYEALVGPIPPGLHIDHLCRVRHCVRPDHLEAVTCAENTRRSRAARKAAAS